MRMCGLHVLILYVGFFARRVEQSLLSCVTLYLYFILYVLLSALSCQRTAAGNKQTSIIRHKASFLYGIRVQLFCTWSQTNKPKYAELNLQAAGKHLQ